MKRLVLHVLGCLPVCLLADVVHADLFVLASGGRIEGELLNPDQSPRRDYRIKTASGGVITMAEGQIEQVLRESEAERWYKRWLPEMPNTANGNWIMAEQCEQRGLKVEREHHLQQVLEHNPDHTQARYAMGYSRVNNDWVRADELMASRGYVRHRGAWRLRQEIELERQAEERETTEIEWRRQVKRWRTWITQRRGKQDEALTKIRTIQDPHAVPALVDLIEDKKTPVQLKMLGIDVLGKLKDGRATMAFVNRVLYDPNENVRDRCLDHLAAWDTERAVAAFIRVLSDQNNRLVNRAGAALGRLKDPHATLPLINALITTHRIHYGSSNPGMGMNTNFTPNGNGGLSVGGGGPKFRDVDAENEGVRNALIAITSVNFGYSKEKWKRWYADENAPQVVDLRRRD